MNTEIIILPKEALFDLFKKEKAKFRSNYWDYEIEISDSDELFDPKEEGDSYRITITKASVIDILMNKNLIKEDYTIII